MERALKTAINVYTSPWFIVLTIALVNHLENSSHTDDERALEWARQTCDAFARGKCPYGGLCEKMSATS